ncbi:MAG: arginine--tRNA ligase, partial [Candidatus Dormibacterales bacterium]
MPLTGTVREAIERALQEAAGELLPDGEMPDLEVGRARNPAHGDYASPAGLKLAGLLRRPPSEIASDLARRVRVANGAAAA